MAIKNVYGKYAKTGIAQRRGGGGIDVSGVIRQANILREAAKDESGNDTPQGLTAAMEYLRPYRNEPRVQLELLRYNTDVNQYRDKVNKAQTDISLFQQALEEELDRSAEQFAGDPVGMINNTADLYLTAFDEYNNNVLPQIERRFRAGEAPPQEVFSTLEEIEQQAQAFTSVANSFNVPNEDGEVGVDNPEAYGFIVQTNPATGAISNVRFKALTSLDGVPKGYMRTNSQLGETGIPVYIPTTQEGDEVVGRLGDRIFRAERPDESAEGATFPQTVLKQQFPGAFNMKILKKGDPDKINLQEFGINEFDIPSGSVLRDGAGRLSYLDRNNVLRPVEDVDALKKLLRETGDNPEEKIAGAYRVSQSFLESKAPLSSGEPINDSFFDSFVSRLKGGTGLETVAPRQSFAGPQDLETDFRGQGKSRPQPSGLTSTGGGGFIPERPAQQAGESVGRFGIPSSPAEEAGRKVKETVSSFFNR